jgi:sigma-B regulation protein RsbQ
MVGQYTFVPGRITESRQSLRPGSVFMSYILSRNNVNISGRGPTPIIFAHGFGCHQDMWRHIVPAFERDYRVILFDYVGCGASDRSAYDRNRYSELDGYAQDILDICDALQVEDVLFVGHSVSSMIGMLAARKSPHLFKKMVMLGPSACYMNYPGYSGGFDRVELEYLVTSIGRGDNWAQILASAVAGNPERPQLAAELEEAFCSLNPETAQEFAHAAFLTDSRQLLNAHDVPTLVIQGADDPIAPVSAGEYVANYIRNGSLAVLPVSGHIPHLSVPEVTVQAMWTYLYNSTQ